MKKSLFLSIVFIIAGLSMWTAPAAATIPPGATGYIIFQSDVDGASVYINDVYRGTIANGEFDISYQAAFTTYRVSRSGYYDASGSIDFPPGMDNLQISANLQLKPIGSSKGWFTVHCNVDGASVSFDGSAKGLISGGVFSYQVSTTGTPYQSYTVSKTGYNSYQGYISTMPSADQTLDLYATLNPIPTPSTYTTTIGGDTGWFVIHGNVNGASVYFDNSYRGMISGGLLNVQVYTTGTPFSTYRVEKTGYATAFGYLPSPPAKGSTRDVYVTLDTVTTPTTAGTIIGGNQGWYVIHANVDGAEVMLDNEKKGVISQGTLTISIYSTGTPYRTLTVKKEGYVPFTSSINSIPGKGETVDLYATLNLVPTSTPMSTPTTLPTTYAPLSLEITGLAVLISSIGVISLLRKSP
jgi:hypothetical protein